MIERNVACILLYDDKKRILLQHRAEDAERLPGYWAFFGGGIEKGETPKEAVIRESLEELSYQLENPELVVVQRFEGQCIKGLKNVFMEKYNPHKGISLNEGQNKGWFNVDDSLKLKMISHDKKVLSYIKGGY